ncbi:MAG: sigma-70 family RNA polymerase sigma factor [Oscillospiraceae bacterium]|nr:sigma-70 family RNA polymerase sigma factor [Oscillospiraceae bacterium]
MSKRILELYFQRSEDAINATDSEYGKLLRQISFNILRNQLDVEECVSDTYLQMWNTIPPNRPESLKAYACKIIRNLSINRLKYLNSEKRSSQEFIGILDELSEAIPSGEDIEAKVEGIALGEEINNFLKQQNKETRIIFIKRYWLFMSTAEISADMRISQTKITSSLHRTRQKLKKHLTEKEYVI